MEIFSGFYSTQHNVLSTISQWILIKSLFKLKFQWFPPYTIDVENNTWSVSIVSVSCQPKMRCSPLTTTINSIKGQNKHEGGGNNVSGYLEKSKAVEHLLEKTSKPILLEKKTEFSC